MKKEDAIKLKIELEEESKELYSAILKKWCEVDRYINDKVWKDVKCELDKPANEYCFSTLEYTFQFTKLDYKYDEKSVSEISEEELETYFNKREEEFNLHVTPLQEMVEKYFKLKYQIAFGIDKLTDMKMEFDGDIIITDPCYIMRKPDKSTQPRMKDYLSYSSFKDYPDYDAKKIESKTHNEEYRKYLDALNEWDMEDDWSICECGSEMENLGFTKYMTRDTLYGDWSCTTYDLDTKESIGSFCADAGLVSVFLLDEVMKYNPDYKGVEENSWSVTCIRDFKGTVEFRVEEVSYEYNGKMCTDNEVKVYGHGINKVTGKPINFVGTQTGL